MEELYAFLKNTLLITQFIAAFVGLLYLRELKNSYWKWFSIYLIVIFLLEFFLTKTTLVHRSYRQSCYIFFILPLEFIFFYWLYAVKSLHNSKIFLLATSTFIMVLMALISVKPKMEVSSLIMNYGSLILILLLILEFIKQIKTDDILNFKENKMFYINLGLIIFYVGSYPYHVFSIELYKNHYEVWSIYYTYFYVSNCIMYVLFTASFIWGKAQS